MTGVLMALGAFLNVAGIVPYIVSVAKKHTKPRIVSWLTWSLLSAVACAASFANHQYPSAVLTLSAVAVTVTVVVFGWKYGDRKFERFDLLCQAGVFVGIGMWLVFGSPGIALAFAISIDFIGALPTLKHSWQKPQEETCISFAAASASGFCALAAADGWGVTAIAYPVYIMVINAVFGGVILGRRKYAFAGEPEEFRDL